MLWTNGIPWQAWENKCDTSTQRTFWAECRVEIQVARRLRQNGTWRNLPIWATTRFPSPSLRERATEIRLYADAIPVCLGTQLFRAFRQDREQGIVLYQNERISCCLLYKYSYCMYLNLCRQAYCCLFSVQKKEFMKDVHLEEDANMFLRWVKCVLRIRHVMLYFSLSPGRMGNVCFSWKRVEYLLLWIACFFSRDLVYCLWSLKRSMDFKYFFLCR